MPFIVIRGTYHLVGKTKTGAPSGFEPDGDSMQLHNGARTETELRIATSLTHRAAHGRLAKLERLGLIASAERETTGPGRPPRAWELVRPESLARFAEQATAFRQALKAKL